MIFNRLKLAVEPRHCRVFCRRHACSGCMRSLAELFSRYVLNQPRITDELARFLMIWVGLLGAAYTRRRAETSLYRFICSPP